jgi:hypothetical protein
MGIQVSFLAILQGICNENNVFNHNSIQQLHLHLCKVPSKLDILAYFIFIFFQMLSSE